MTRKEALKAADNLIEELLRSGDPASCRRDHEKELTRIDIIRFCDKKNS